MIICWEWKEGFTYSFSLISHQRIRYISGDFHQIISVHESSACPNSLDNSFVITAATIRAKLTLTFSPKSERSPQKWEISIINWNQFLMNMKGRRAVTKIHFTPVSTGIYWPYLNYLLSSISLITVRKKQGWFGDFFFGNSWFFWRGEEGTGNERRSHLFCLFPTLSSSECKCNVMSHLCLASFCVSDFCLALYNMVLSSVKLF